jgi:hypothetical protein
VNTYYFSQSIGANRRTPDTRAVHAKLWDPLYEVYIQKMVPKQTHVVPHRYGGRGYAEFKAKRRARRMAEGLRIRRQRSASSSSASSSDDDDDKAKYVGDVDAFWDE